MNKKSNTKKGKATTIERKVSARADYGRVTEVQLDERLYKICELILSGHKLYEIQNIALMPIAEGGWGWEVSDRQVANYYKKAFKMVTDLPTKSELQDKLKMLIEQYSMLFKSALKKGDLKTANSILKNMGDLLPMRELAAEIAEIKKTEKIDVSFVSEFGIDDAKAQISSLKSKSLENED